MDLCVESQAKEHFVPLSRALDLPAPSVGNKAYNLAKLSAAGFRVPDAICLTTAVHDFFINTGTVPAEAIIAMHEFMRRSGGRVALRSSASCEDSSDLTMAGVFSTVFVDSVVELLPALTSIYRQARDSSVADYLSIHGRFVSDVQMGVVIQTCIEADVAGVIYCGADDGRTVIEYLDGPGAVLVDGQRRGSTIILDKQGVPVDFIGLSLDVSITRQLSAISASIACMFSGRQDVEFVVHGRDVFVLQARPLPAAIVVPEIRETPDDTLEFVRQYVARIAQKEQRDFGSICSVFSDANYSELLPRPTEMDIGVYMYIFTGCDGVPGATQRARREMGYRNEEESVGIIAPIGGRAYFSVARNAALYQAGFPETKDEYFKILIRHYLEATQANPDKASYPQMGLYLQDPTEADLQLLFPGRERRYVEAQLDFNRRIADLARSYSTIFKDIVLPHQAMHLEAHSRVSDDMSAGALASEFTALLEHLRLHTCVAFVKIARLGFYYSQRLISIIKASGMAEREAHSVFSRLTQGLEGSHVTDANLAIANAATDREAISIATREFGHTSSGEMLELRHPFLRDVPGAVEAYAAGIRENGRYADEYHRQRSMRLITEHEVMEAASDGNREELAEVIRNCQIYMALRETAKYSLSSEYALIRRTLQKISAKADFDGDDIYFLYPREVTGALVDSEWYLHLIKGRRRAWHNYSALALPHVIYSNKLSDIQLRGGKRRDAVVLQGRFLAPGICLQGVVVNVDSHASIQSAAGEIAAARSRQQSVILVATQLNLSHDPLIYQADGLIIENAGLVSHGAQRAREIGRGAIGGIDAADLPNGTVINFDPANAVVTRVQAETLPIEEI